MTMLTKRIASLLLLTILVSGIYAQKSNSLPEPRNIIIMIGDGMGYNHIKALNYFEGKAEQVYEGFPVRLAQAHYPALAGEYEENKPGSNFIAAGYDPSQAWKSHKYLKRNFTESAASGTALATGVKTYNNAIGMSVKGDTASNAVEWAKATGRSAGVVSSVPFNHATPAAFTTHNKTRKDLGGIALGMLFGSRCDVIMGCGDPGFNDNGKALTSWKGGKKVGDSLLWSDLMAGSGHRTAFRFKGKELTVRDADGDGNPDPWHVVRSTEEFRKLMEGPVPPRVLGVPMVGSTLQQGRKMENGETRNSPPFVTPFNTGVPALEEMSLGALNVLNNNPKGFFLMVEGGAIDWAGHGNQKGRLIEEMQQFSRAVEAVVKWVEQHSSWEETLLVVTSDHETGLLWGKKPFESLTDHGKGVLPGMKFHSNDHSNSLVPFFARGAGSELYRHYADEYDEIRGPFLQNSEVPQLIRFLWYR